MTTPILNIAELNATTQERILFNNGLRHLEAYLCGLTAFGVNTPPSTPGNGYKVIIGTSPTGVWAGFANYVTIYLNGAYVFIPPSALLGAQFLANGSAYYRWSGTAWILGTVGIGSGGITVREDDNTPSGAVSELVFPSGSLEIFGGTGKVQFATGLISDRTFYVRNDGADVNTGTGNTSAEAFQTLSKAVSEAARINKNGFTITISFFESLTTSTPIVLPLSLGAGRIVLDGNNTGELLVSNSFVDVTPYLASGILIASASGYSAKNMGLRFAPSTYTAKSNFAGIYAAEPGVNVDFSNINFKTFIFAGINTQHIRSEDNSRVLCAGNYTISGNTSRHITLVGSGIYRCQGKTITLQNTPAWGSVFLEARTNSVAFLDGNTYSGAATGVRYSVLAGARCQTFTPPDAYLPGSINGSVDAQSSIII